MRVSDTERQRAIDELRRHCAEGRLDIEEYASRVEKALTATTLEELDRLRADLPMLRIAEPSGAGGIWARPSSSRPRVGGPAATVSVLLLVAAVLAVVVLSVAASWTWAALLALGWLAGAAYTRARGTRL